MMFILFILFAIDYSQSFEWNCTNNKYLFSINDRIYEQCTIRIEYRSLERQNHVCIGHTLSIKTLPFYSFSSNYTMDKFQINSCQLLTLSQLPFSLPSTLEQLDLSSNLLSTFTFAFPLPTHIKYLRLDNNPNLINIHFGYYLSQQQYLLGLSLRHNKYVQLTTLPMNLKQLDLTNCNLLQSSMLTLLKSLTKLTDLSLANNQLERLPELNERLKLEYFNLSNNYLTFIDSKSIHEHLQNLDIRNNRLKSLEFFKDLLKSYKTFEENMNSMNQTNINNRILQLSFSGNPLNCDCWLEELIDSKFINITDLSLLECYSKSITNVNRNYFQCYYSRHCSIDCTCCDFEACDCHSVCPSECLCSHDAFWSKNIVQCQEKNLTNIHLFLPETVTELNYEGNHIEEIKPYVFVGKTYLQRLNLANNNINYLMNDTFCAASNINEINLSLNRNLKIKTSNLNELFSCLKYLQIIILSNEQIDNNEQISFGWSIETTENTSIHRFRRIKYLTSSVSSTIQQLTSLSPSSIYSTLDHSKPLSTVVSVYHQQSFTSSNLIEHNQKLMIVIFFLLLFVLLFLLLLISLAICRRKIHRHLKDELQRQRSQQCYSDQQHHHHHHHINNNSHRKSIKLTISNSSNNNNGNVGINDSIYEQLPSLSSDSEQPFLYSDKKATVVNVPTLPPYPPTFHPYHCCHGTTTTNSQDYQYVMSMPISNLQSHQCPSILVLKNHLICPKIHECSSDIQQISTTNPFLADETILPTRTLCQCHNHIRSIDTNIYPTVHR